MSMSALPCNDKSTSPCLVHSLWLICPIHHTSDCMVTEQSVYVWRAVTLCQNGMYMSIHSESMSEYVCIFYVLGRT